MNDDKIKLLTEVIYLDGNDQKSEQIYIDFSSFDTLNQLVNHLCKILKITKRKSEKIELYVHFQGSRIKLYDIKNFFMVMSNCVVLNCQLQIELEFKTDSREFEFDIRGEKCGTNEFKNTNRPSDTRYDVFQNKEVFCRFCNKSSKNELYLRKCGPFYGPFKDGDKQNFVHEYCALWAPNVHLDSAGKLKRVNNEIKRARVLDCTYCGESGAPTCCNGKSCKKQYHYLCAVNEECFLDWDKYLIYCRRDMGSMKNTYDLTEEQLKQEVNRDKDSNDPREAICCVCFSGLDEDVLIICDQCHVAYHNYCHDPVVNEAIGDVNKKWYCKNCNHDKMNI